jgi:hypothetical protein
MARNNGDHFKKGLIAHLILLICPVITSYFCDISCFICTSCWPFFMANNISDAIPLPKNESPVAGLNINPFSLVAIFFLILITRFHR